MSIVLNLLGNGLKLKQNPDPDLEEYSSVDKCFRDLLVLAIAAGDPVALCTTGETLGVGDESLSSTWLCRPKHSDLGSAPEAEKLPEMSTDGIVIDQSPSISWINLDGYLLSVSDTPTADSREVLVARLIVTMAKELKMGLSPTGEVGDVLGFGPAPDYSAWQYQTTTPEGLECFITTLACVLYCGHSWLANTATRCSFPPLYVQEMVHNAAIHKDRFNQIPYLIMQPTWDDVKQSWQGLSAILRFTNWLMAWGHNATPGLRENWTPHLFKVGETKVLTFAKDYDGEPHIFFPACLAKDAYVRLARAWVLQPSSVGGNNRLAMRGKTRIFSPMSLENVGGSGFVFSREKIIHG